MNFRLGLALLFTLGFLVFSQNANAQSAPLVVLTPDGVTGEVIFKVNTNTNDARLTESCIYRIDARSPDPDAPLACAPVTEGREPVGDEVVPSGEGVVLEIPLVVSILPEDQHFGVRNIADIAGTPISSALSSNKAVLPLAVVAPLFVVEGSRE